jgi:hypothetical protein
MQRIARVKQRPALRSSFSVGIRYNSTEVPPKPNGTAKRVVRVPLLRLGDIVIRECSIQRPENIPNLTSL